MSDPEVEDADVRDAVAQLLKARMVGFLLFGVAVGVGVILAIVLSNTNAQRLAPVSFALLIGIGLVSLIRVFSTKCPACGKLFFNAPIRALYASTCYHCKAGIK